MSRSWSQSGRSTDKDADANPLPDQTHECNYYRCRGETTFVAFGHPSEYEMRCEACGKELIDVKNDSKTAEDYRPVRASDRVTTPGSKS